MLTSKERAGLRALAQKENAIFQLGKNGITESFINEVSIALDSRELVKINVLKSCDFSSREVIGQLSMALDAEEVQAIGNKVILYRRSTKEGVKHLL